MWRKSNNNIQDNIIMATINTTIELKSNSEVAGILSLSYNKKKKIDISTALGDTIDITTGDTEILTTSESNSRFIYITNPHSSNQVILKTGGGVAWGIIEPGDWAFFTVKKDIGLKICTSLGTIGISYLSMLKST